MPCISLAVVLSEWLAGRPIARMKIDAQGSDLDVVKSAGPYLKQLLFIVMETQGTFEALLYEGQASCDQVQAEMRALGFILADTRSLPACNRTGALPYPFHEEDIAFVRRELHHLWRDFYYEHPYCQHGIVSAAGACGGPYCMAPEFNMHVNRSGGCADQIQDILAFPSDAIGMVLLWTSANCIRNIEVTMDGMGPRNLRVQVLQGRARGKRQCPSKFDAVQSLHGPIVRVRSGSSDHRVQMLLLPGFLNITSAKLEEALEYFFYVVENSGASNFHLIWPRACVELRADALPHRISTGYRPVNQPSGSTCAMEKRPGLLKSLKGPVRKVEELPLMLREAVRFKFSAGLERHAVTSELLHLSRRLTRLVPLGCANAGLSGARHKKPWACCNVFCKVGGLCCRVSSLEEHSFQVRIERLL